MSSIDERVVEMKFDNSQFESGVSSTLKSLTNLKNGLNFKGSTDSLDGLTKSANNLSSSGLSGIAAGVSELSNRFSAMGIVGMTVLSNITSAVMSAGASLYSNLINPIVSGGWTRASNIEQAKFQIEGLGKDWKALSQDITQAVDGTAYGFDEAAMAAGQLSASGIQAGEQMEHSLQGISGTAAMTGRSYTDIAQIFATVAGNGRLMSEQLLQFSASGINAAAVLANYLGKDEATVRDMVSNGEIDFQTFSDAMYSAFGEHAKDANKTFTGAMSNVHAAMSKIGADFESVLISSDDQANGINNLIGILNAFRNVLNGVRTSLQQTALPDFTKTVHALCDVVVNFLNSMFEVVDKDGKQVTQLVEPLRTAFSNFYSAFKNVADFVISIASTLGSAWNEIFPPVTFDTIKNISSSFKGLTDNLKLNADQQEKLKNIAKGLFSAIDLVGKVLGSICDAAGRVVVAMAPLGSLIVDIVEAIANYITGFDSAVDSTNTFGSILDIVVGDIHGFSEALSNLIRNFGPTLSKFISDAANAFKNFVSSIGKSNGLDNGANAFTSFIDKIKEGIDWLKNNISLGDIFAGLLTGGALSIVKSILDVINPIKKAIHGLFGGDIKKKGNTFTQVIDQVKECLGNFTKAISVGSLVAIAVAVGILTASICAISNLKIPNAVASIAAIGAMLAMLCATLKSMTKTLSGFKSSGMVKVAVALIGVAIAINILASAVKKFSEIDPFDLVKGIAALAVMMKVLTSSIKSLDKNVSLKTSVALLAIAASVSIIAGVVERFSGMSWEEIAKGLGTLTGALLITVAAIKGISSTDISIGTSLAIIAVADAARNLANALSMFAAMSWEEIERGLVGMGGALAELVIALKVLNTMKGGKALATSLSLVAIVFALGKLADALQQIGSMSWDEIARGLVGLGGALAELIASIAILNKFDSTDSLASTVILLLVVQALAPIADALQQIGSLSWESIAKGLVGMGGALAELALVAGLLGKFGSFGSLAGAVAVLIMAQALKPIGETLQQIGSMSWDEIGRGLFGMGGALAELAIVSGLLGDLSPLAMLGSGAILLGAQGLGQLADALQKFGDMSWDEIGRGLTAMGAAMGETALGGILNTFSGFGASNIGAMAGPLGDLADAMSKWKDVTLPDTLGDDMYNIAHGVMQFTLGGMGADTIGSVAGPLGTLADSVNKWSTITIPDGLGDQLSSLASGVGAWWLSGGGADAIATVAGPLGTLADSVIKWTGVTVPDGLGDQLSSLASGVSAFWTGGWGADAIATVAGPLGTLADSVAKWSSVAIPEGLNDQLSSLASGVESFSFAALGGWSISTICDPLSQLADSVQKWVSVSVPEGIGDQLSNLASGIQAFSWCFMGGWSLDTITGPLGDLAGSVQKWNGVSIPDNLGDQLSSLASGIQAFSWCFMGGWSLGAITGPLGDLASSVTKWNGVSIPDGLGDQLSSLSSGISSFSSLGSDVGTNISSISTGLSSLSTSVSQIAFVDYAGAANNLTTFVDSINSTQTINTGFADQLNAFAASIVVAMSNLNTTVSTASFGLSASFAGMAVTVGFAIMSMSATITSNMAMMIASVSGSSAAISAVMFAMSASISVAMFAIGAAAISGSGMVSGAMWGMSGSVSGAMGVIIGSALGGAGSVSAAMGMMSGAASSATGSLSGSFGSMVAVVTGSLATMVGCLLGNVGTFLSAGSALGNAFASGIRSAIGTVISAGSQLGSSAAGGIGNHYNEFYSCGSNLAQGMANGISSGHDAVVNAAAALGRASVTAVNDATRVGSPSRLTYKTGMFFDLGLRNGIRNYAKLVKMEADDVASSAISSTNGLADQVYEYASDDLSPTITPVVDLTNVRKSFSTISSMIPNQTIGINTSSTANAIGNVIPASQQILAAQAAPSNTTISGDTYTVSLNGITYNDRNDMQDVTRNYIRELTRLAAM